MEIFKKFVDKMKGDDDFAKKFYMSVTFILLALSAALLMMAFFPHPGETGTPAGAEPELTEPQPQATVPGEPLPLGLTFSEEEVAGLIALALRGKVEAKDIYVQFSEPDGVALGGTVEKSSIKELLGDKFSPLKLALIFAPDELELKAEGRISFDDTLKLSVESATVAGISVEGSIPEGFEEALGSAITSALPEGVTVTGVELRDGEIEINFTA